MSDLSLANAYEADERRRFEAGETTTAFAFGSHTIQALLVDGEPWFVANDVAETLGYSRGRDALRMVDDEDRGARILRSPSGQQEYNIINESGLYQMILGSRSEDAKRFKRWVTSEVLPAIRKTGRYAPAEPSTPKTFAAALRLAAEQQEALEAAEAARQVAEEARAAIQPSADAWDNLGTGDGSWSLAEAAKILAQEGIRTGQNRMFQFLYDQQWIMRRGGDWEPRQAAVEAGWLVAKPQAYQRDGKTILAKPQVRLTPAGMARLRTLLKPSKDLAQF